ncbi:MAG: LamG domain-containing protein [Kiritimatiellaeota bacterium]|nr:LamG domain-containing protein [Kiritimatiellota bacterium]
MARRDWPLVVAVWAGVCALSSMHGAPPRPPLTPFEPDKNTLLLYHFDESGGDLARDASGHGYHGAIQDCRRVSGRFGGGLAFNGRTGCVFRKSTPALRDIARLTVECWFAQDDPTGRQFLVGLDVGFHFDLSNGEATSLSIYNQGGRTPNAAGLRHQQVSTRLGRVRSRRWHHLAATYDGSEVSFFLDGVLVDRLPAARDFRLGADSRGLWVGCYIGREFWFRGRMDEIRVSDCIRYDPERRLAKGGKVFDMPVARTQLTQEVRRAKTHGKARLGLELIKRHGGAGAGWVCLKPPGRPAAIIGKYALDEKGKGRKYHLEFDVSDEYRGDGLYLVGLYPTTESAYFTLTSALLTAAGKPVAAWSGRAESRRTFRPPVLAALRVGPVPGKAITDKKGGAIVRTPRDVDRFQGNIEIDDELPDQPPVLWGDGFAEYWIHVPVRTVYRVFLRYAATAPHPCDLVVDGDDLHPFNMCARNATGGPGAVNAFWEYQGPLTLERGVHWIRLQDVLPDTVALRLEPAAAPPPPYRTPRARFPEPGEDVLAGARNWRVQPTLGRIRDATAAAKRTPDGTILRFAATFANTDRKNLFAGDCVRFVHALRADFEPFGRLRFATEDRGAGHVVSLWLLDAKGDEKLLWRGRDETVGRREISVPVSFEGNDVFDPGHVVAVAVELDEGNVRAENVNRFEVKLISPRFERRDALRLPPDRSAQVARALAMAATVQPRSGGAALRSPGFRPWARPVVPEEYPTFAAADPKPVTRAALGYGLHFTGARGINPNTLDDFHRRYDFGDICWPHIGMLPQRNRFKSETDYTTALTRLRDRLRDVRGRSLFLFDIWGYVPHNPRFPWKVAADHHAILLRVLGDHFLGYDNGEQDGRYIGSYADRGAFTTRRGGWEDFVRWDKSICADSMNYMNATGSLNFSHYYGERGCRTLGLETAQGLPSDTLMFAFLRGAGKQYGRLITQATSVWNRFGYKIYSGRKTTGARGYGYGPHKGCSLSLHKRLMLCSYLGGHSIVGTETAQFTADRLENGAPELSPLGRQHLRIRQWVKRHPDRGVMFTPVAFMLDFYSGWTVPRHLYRRDKYKVWGKLPYGRGDYMADQVFRLVWPGYQDCSYLRNERGFITPTPFGDIFDVLTNRCPPHVLRQYTAIMLVGRIEMTAGIVRDLLAFVRAGGDVLLDVRLARAFPGDAIQVPAGPRTLGHLTRVCATGKTFEEPPFHFEDTVPVGAAPLLTDERGRTLVSARTVGRGRMIVSVIDGWMTDRLEYEHPDLVNMEPPYRLLHGVRALLAGYFDSFSPVAISPPGLTFRTCLYADDPRRMLVGLLNDDLFATWEGAVRVRVGHVVRVRDIWRDRPLPSGRNIPVAIEPGGVALLDVRLE